MNREAPGSLKSPLQDCRPPDSRSLLQPRTAVGVVHEPLSAGFSEPNLFRIWDHTDRRSNNAVPQTLLTRSYAFSNQRIFERRLCPCNARKEAYVGTERLAKSAGMV